MIAWVKQLLYPTLYLKIKYNEGLKSKAFLDLYFPIILVAILHLLSFWINGDWPSLSSKARDEVASFLTLAFPFYVAALTAVSTFPSKTLDETFSGDKPEEQATLKVWSNDEERYVIDALTRRRFLAFLFGYLSFLSLMLIVVLMFDNGFNISGILVDFPAKIQNIIRSTINFLFWIVLTNITFATLLALRFLVKRVSAVH